MSTHRPHGLSPDRESAPAFRPAPLPDLRSALATRRAIFGPHELREDRITADSRLADNLSTAARRALREGENV